jgi:zinc transport system ATP-binding protein
MTANEPVIEVENLDFTYDGHLVLEDICLTVGERDFLGVIGPNGGGKTTLLKIILGLLPPMKGTVRVFGEAPERARKRIGYVPQQTDLDRGFPISVMDVVLIGRLGRAPAFWRYAKEDYLAAQKAMEKLKIPDLRHRPFGTLSGGQKQRALIARALAGDPALLILDEPTVSVDGHVEQDIYDLLKQLNEKAAILLVSHDLGFVSAYVNRVACVNKRLACHPINEVTKDTIEACYTGPVHMVDHHCKL